jgi:hypothetical protein
MENKMSGRIYLSILLVFVISSLLVVVLRSTLAGWDMDYRVLLGGNIILFLASALSLYLYSRALKSTRIHAVVRVAYGTMMIKMFGCIAATLLYLWAAGPSASKRAIIACFSLYIIYSFLEVKILMQLNKKSSPNA